LMQALQSKGKLAVKYVGLGIHACSPMRTAF
jgi:hypothetical protein